VKTWTLGSSLFVALASTTLVHCSSSASSAEDAGPVPVDGSMRGSPDSAVPVDSSFTSPDGGHPIDSSVTMTDAPVGDTASACVTPPKGSPCDPGNFTCNGAPCAVPTNVCCGTTPTAAMCQPAATTCAGSSFACDEKGDCANGQICCFVAVSTTAANNACTTGTTCSGGLFSIQICKTDAECTNGMSCVPQSCPVGGSTVTIGACGAIPTCTAL
jgi:hypothetical protein